MGISGLGATASAGADAAKNRLDFDVYAWLINRGWLPYGGFAESNVASWKDIVSTGGEFDVYRFQMIAFSMLVGAALINAGTELTDLSSFDIPTALLGILGLSHLVVYVAGKLVAPPSISDLNEQIKKLQAAEKDLKEKLVEADPAFLGGISVLVADSNKIKLAEGGLRRVCPGLGSSLYRVRVGTGHDGPRAQRRAESAVRRAERGHWAHRRTATRPRQSGLQLRTHGVGRRRAVYVDPRRRLRHPLRSSSRSMARSPVHRLVQRKAVLPCAMDSCRTRVGTRTVSITIES